MESLGLEGSGVFKKQKGHQWNMSQVNRGRAAETEIKEARGPDYSRSCRS